MLHITATAIGNLHKRGKIFTYLKDKIKNGVCFLQETHSIPSQEQKWQAQWNGKMYFSHGSSNSTGCAIAFTSNFNFQLIKESKDTSGRFLILEVLIDKIRYLMINLYNANSEVEQLQVLDSLASKLDDHDTDGDCIPIFGGDFNLYFDTSLDCSGGNPLLKKRSIAKLMTILDRLDASDIFRIRFPDTKQYTFLRKNPTIRRRLDYIFISNNVQEFVDTVKILPSYMSDHAPVLITINPSSSRNRGNYSWKFNNSLLQDLKFSTEIRTHFDKVKDNLQNLSNAHLKWEFFKYEARKFSISFSKMKKKEDNDLRIFHEDIVHRYTSTENQPTEAEYADSKTYLESYYEKKTQGLSLRSKTVFYEDNEKSTKYFLNLEKKRGEKSTIRKLVDNNIELTDTKDILHKIHSFYSNLFDRKIAKSNADCINFLDTLNLPLISDDHKKHCDADISVDDLKESLFSMSNNKTPGNDGLTAEFYKFFWEDLKDILLESYKYSLIVGELSTSQRQAIIKLIEKKDKDKRFIENWRPISLLNIDTKILSKCIASRLIPVLPSVISSDQTAYVKGRYIGLIL